MLFMFDHNGLPLRPNDVLLAPPPPSIGTVLSADTTLRPEKKEPVARIVAAALCGFVLGFIAGGMIGGLADRLRPEPPLFEALIGGAIGAVLLGLVGMVALAMDFTSYVGRDGIALFTKKRSLTSSSVCFCDVWTRDVETTLLTAAGVPHTVRETHFYRDGTGRVVFQLTAVYGPRETPPPGNLVYFARAAAQAFDVFDFRRRQSPSIDMARWSPVVTWMAVSSASAESSDQRPHAFTLRSR